MKYVLLLAVVGVVLWLMFGRGRRTEQVRQRETKRALGYALDWAELKTIV